MIGESESLREFLSRPLTIGGCVIPKRLVLAPLSKLGHVAFREVVTDFGGAGLLFSEMSGARGIPNGNGHVLSGYYWQPGELPYLVCQIYGDDPHDMAKAAARVRNDGAFGVDLNFGCSVKSIMRHGCGAALLKDPDKAQAIVAAVREAVDIPVFVKFRTGWTDDARLAVDLARRFESAGADALTYHPRVAPDRRTRPPRWAYIGEVKAAVSIPVFGNGDVFDAADAERMIRLTGCDGIALGRIAVARPWIFAQWADGFTPPESIYRDTALSLVDRMSAHFPPEVVMRRFRKFSLYYAANFTFGHTFYSLVHRAKNVEGLRGAIESFFGQSQGVLERPNITMLR